MRWRLTFIEEHDIHVGCWLEEVIQPRTSQLGSAPVYSAKPKVGICADQVCSHLPFQSSCRLPRQIVRLPAYWQRASSSGTSRTVLCRAQHGYCSTPDGHPPDNILGMSTAPACYGSSCPSRISALFLPASHYRKSLGDLALTYLAHFSLIKRIERQYI